MDKLKVGESVYLEQEREYIVVCTVEKDNKDYAYLVTKEEPYKVKFAEEIFNEDNLDLKIVDDKNLKQQLLEVFKEKMSK